MGWGDGFVYKVNVPSIPRSEKVLRRASCTALEEVGDCVRISGNKVGSLYDVRKHDPTTPGYDQAVGVVVKKYDATTCRVQFSGPVKSVYTGLVPGRRYFVGSDSKLSLDSGSPGPGEWFLSQLMGVAVASDEVELSPGIVVALRG